MKQTIALLFFVMMASQATVAQNLKKKYLGTYSGTVPPYSIDAGGEVLTVRSASVNFILDENSAAQTIDGITVTGKWQLIATKPDYYEIGFTPENSVVLQKFFLFKKGKKMERDGIYPQPDCVLTKEN